MQKAKGTRISCFLTLRRYPGLWKITAERMKAVLNIEAPKIEPNGINSVEGDELEPANIAVKTSGAPFANAKNVTPANVGEISV